MKEYQAVLFDLDDTLLSRDLAIDQLFFIILEKCYEDTNHSEEMLRSFKECDKRSYGDNDKSKVLNSFFDEYPPKNRLPCHSIQDFWNHHFPQCFSIDPKTIQIINAIKQQAKVAIITNGSVQRQNAKIMNTHLNSCFDTIIISEEVGLSKPDKRIFELALNELNVRSEEALFVGDDIEKDIGGSQTIHMKGIWFNPHKRENDTTIKPYAEIWSLDRLLDFLPGGLAEK
ncbi:HAD family hydrolase [Peribacillus faecalis]|uniref:HAD family hydrolase n=1 Tax=Peribacillus faecalis TaxID=2772559 RepID=UPI001F3A1156|nr:HAD family hydrolase [Peribacillus faecalis]